jgi:hypothetical protein
MDNGYICVYVLLVRWGFLNLMPGQYVRHTPWSTHSRNAGPGVTQLVAWSADDTREPLWVKMDAPVKRQS